jgi:metal-responsive CopG/Arc/MetJ family transcriptional regulator
VIRTQISLPAELMAAAKQAAAQRGISLAALVRKALEQYLATDDRQRRVDRAKRAVGGFRSGHGHLARDHDDALAQDRW